MKLIKRIVKFTGLWTYPIGLICEGLLIWQLWDVLGYGRRPPRQDIIYMWIIIPLIIPILIILRHLGKTPTQGITEHTKQKKEAMYPDIPSEYLVDVDKPDGIIIGEWRSPQDHKRYLVRYPITPRGITHLLTLGNTGCGKTTCIFFCLTITNAMRKNYRHMSVRFCVYCTDPKPELYNAVNAHSKAVRIMNLASRESWGFEVYYFISNKTTDSEMAVYLKGIAKTLITGPDDAKFFVNSAIKIFIGLMLVYHHRKLGFIDSILELINHPLDEQLDRALADKKNCPKGSVAYALLVSFGHFEGEKFVLKDSQALQDVEMTLQEELPDTFSNAEVIWHLRDNPRKASPADLQRGISLFDSSPENSFDDFPLIFRLKIFLILRELKSSERQKKDVIPCFLLLEELFKIGRIPDLDKILASIRSKKTACLLSLQDYSQLEQLYGEKGARSIANLCRIKLILSCDDYATADTLCKMTGDFREPTTTKVGSGPNASENSSECYRHIIEPSDLMQLDELEEIVAFIKGRYLRVKKHYYFKDPILSKIYKDNEKNNEFLDM